MFLKDEKLKAICLFCVLALVFSMAACSKAATDGETDFPASCAPETGGKEPDDKGTEGQDPEKDPSAGATEKPGATSGDVPIYFLVYGTLIGKLENGEFVSMNDVNGRYENEYSAKISLKEFLMIDGLYMYGKEPGGYTGYQALTGYTDSVAVYLGDGLGGLTGENKKEQLSPYAKTVYERWEHEAYARFMLPTYLGDECADIMIPDYGSNISRGYVDFEDYGIYYFGLDMFATNNKKLMFIPAWEGEAAQEDADFVKNFFKETNFNVIPNFTHIAAGDFDADGSGETVLFANSKRDEGGYIKEQPGESGGYSAVIFKDHDGNYQVLDYRTVKKTDDVTSYFTFSPIGIFDLNDDKNYEICYIVGEWEGGHTKVLGVGNDGKYKCVMRANWGT